MKKIALMLLALFSLSFIAEQSVQARMRVVGNPAARGARVNRRRGGGWRGGRGWGRRRGGVFIGGGPGIWGGPGYWDGYGGWYDPYAYGPGAGVGFQAGPLSIGFGI